MSRAGDWKGPSEWMMDARQEVLLVSVVVAVAMAAKNPKLMLACLQKSAPGKSPDEQL